MKFRHSFAVIVGINDYHSGVPILQTPISDALKIAEVLQHQHGYETHLLLDEKASRSHLVELFEKTLPQRVKSGDRLIFYFAGHGIALNGEDGPAGYLVPQDARLGNVNTYLSMSQVHQALHQLPCHHFLGILDCCFAGSFRWSSCRDIELTAPSIIHQERFERFIQDPAWQVITSAAHDQTAADAFGLKAQRGERGQHSPFAAALIEALQGEDNAATKDQLFRSGVITATALYMYLRDRVEIATVGTLRQTPGIHPLKKHDKGEFIFLQPGHSLHLPPAPPLDDSQNPYRGLQSFETQHSGLFFGREKLVKKLQVFAETHALTVVLGPSGAGKSSLVKAGLIPRLQQENKEQWLVLSPIRPGKKPLQALNSALAEAGLSTIEIDSQKTLAQSVATWSRHQSSHTRLLIFIDQSEEIVSLCSDKVQRQTFIQTILSALDDHPDKLRVVLSMRSDFEPQVRDIGLALAAEIADLQGQSALRKRWQSGRFIVPVMARAELREAIERPAEMRVMYFESDELVNRLIDEVADMPGALPLLSFALSELYLRYLQRQREAQIKGIVIARSLTQFDYEALGGVIQSLTQRASQEYSALVKQDVAYAQMTRHVMLRMVTLGGGELVRRRVPLFELDYPSQKNRFARTVIERFSTARLLVKGRDAAGYAYVEPAHDALVRGWEKLQVWVAEEKDLVLQRRLTPAALAWRAHQTSQRPAQYLWHTNPYLDVLAKGVLNSDSNNWLNQIELEFVQHSLKKRRNNSRRLAASVIAIISALSGFGLFAVYQWQQAGIGQVEALVASSNANFSVNRSSLDALVDALTASDRLQQLPLSRHNQQLQTNVLTALAQSVSWVREETRLAEHDNVIQSIRFSPDGQMIATGSHDQTIKLWRADGTFIRTLEGHTDAVMSVEFSADSQTIISGSLDGTVNLWNRNGRLLRQLPAQSDSWVMSVGLGPNLQIATASDDNTVRLWQGETGKLIQTMEGHQNTIRQVAYSPTGDKVVTGGEDETIKLWSPTSQTPIETIEQHTGAITGIAFSQNGLFFATSSQDGTVRVWNAAGGAVSKFEHPGPVWSVGISPSGELIASGSGDGTLRLWTKEGRLLDSWLGHKGIVPSLAFSPDGQQLGTVGNDGLLKLWQVNRDWLTVLSASAVNPSFARFSPDGQHIAAASGDRTTRIWNRDGVLLSTLKGHDDWVNTVSFHPTKALLASGSDDGTIKLWQKEGQLLSTIEGHASEVIYISFSPDGQRLAAANADGTAKLWNLAGEEIAMLEGHDYRVLSIAFSADGQTIATSGDLGLVKLWNLKGEELQVFSSGESAVWAVGFSPDGTQMVTANHDKTAKLWKADGTLIKTLTGHTAAVLDASYSPDGTTIATASSDRTIKLWKPDGTLIVTLSGHQDDVRTVSFSADSQQLVSASADRTVLVWNISDLGLEDLANKGCRYIHSYLATQPKTLQQICPRLK